MMFFWALVVGGYVAATYPDQDVCIQHAVQAYHELKLDQMFPGSNAHEFFDCKQRVFI